VTGHQGTCRSCKREIWFAPTGNTKADGAAAMMPVERVQHVYVMGVGGVLENVLPLEQKFISHFVSCPDAKTWSGKSRKADSQQKELLPDGSSEGT
jgi:hypothetical protein